MNVISATTIVFGAVLLWTSSTCNGEVHGNYTSCFSQSPCPALLGLLHTTAATSCQEIYKSNPHAPSGNYWLRRGEHSAANVTEQYCNMDGTYDGIKGGWLRVAYLDMEDAGTRCPLPLQETNPGKRLCIKSAPTGCSSVVYSTHGVPYTRICGRVRGYQYESPDAFGFHTGPKNINSAYTDGVSITYGSPRKHVWTYAAGLQEDTNYRGDACPCGTVPGNQPPSFVGNDYYCESANQGPWEAQWFLQDPLWDGHGCPSDNNCCANAGLPWFCKTLPTKVTEDIEVRLCRNQGGDDEDIGVELLEILVH